MTSSSTYRGIPSVFGAAAALFLFGPTISIGFSFSFLLFGSYLCSKFYGLDWPSARELKVRHWWAIVPVVLIAIVHNITDQPILDSGFAVSLLWLILYTGFVAAVIRFVDYLRAGEATTEQTIKPTHFHRIPAVVYVTILLLALAIVGVLSPPGYDFHLLRILAPIGLGCLPIAFAIARFAIAPRITKERVQRIYLPISFGMIMALTFLASIIDLRGPIAFNPGTIALILTLTIPMPVLLATLEFLRTYERKIPRNNPRNSS